MSLILANRTSTGGRHLLTYEQRQWIREERSRIMRSKVKKKTRQPDVLPRPLLPADVLEAAFRTYADGVSVRDIANSLWRRHGYSTPKICAQALTNYINERMREAA